MMQQKKGKRDRTVSEGNEAWGRTSFHIGTTSSQEAADRLSLQIPGAATAVSNLWSKIGTLSNRASEVLEDARLTYHGKEKRLYEASVQRLSCTNDSALNSLGERLSLDANHVKSEGSSLEDDIQAAQDMVERASIEIVMTATEAHWEGTLSKRSQWLRRWEKYFFVLDGRQLKRTFQQLYCRHNIIFCRVSIQECIR